MKLVAFVALVVFGLAVHFTPTDALKRPVILVHGFAGAQVYSTDSTSHKDAKHEWVTAKNMFFSSGFTDRFRLLFDMDTKKTFNMVTQTFFPGVDELWSVEYLGRIFNIKKRAYFRSVIKTLGKMSYYKNGKNVAAVTYDWRRGLEENYKFIFNLKDTVEKMYTRSGNTKVVIVTHSMGGLMTTFALNNLPLEWKKQYISSVFYVGAPFGGSVKAMRALLSGEDFGFPNLIKSENFRRVLTTFPSSYMLLPHESAFGKKTFMNIFLNGQHKGITPQNIKDVFDITGNKYGKAMYEAVNTKFNQPEGVEIHCMYANNVPTVDILNYLQAPQRTKNRFVQEALKTFTTNPQEVTLPHGDGTVNIQSLRICQKWNETRVTEITDVNHIDIIDDWRMLDYVKWLATR